VFWSLPQKEVEFLELPGRVRAYLLRSRNTPACEAVAAIPDCLRAIAARHFEGLTLRRARNCRFSASLKVASYARRARSSYRQATSAKTANAMGTAKGIICS
jgi:hypothetical protein